jgi:hypothetical protein
VAAPATGRWPYSSPNRPSSTLWDRQAGRLLVADESPTAYAPTPEIRGIRAFATTRYDPGSAAYRYHSAANTAPGGTSAFARYLHENPHCDLRQYDVETQRTACLELAGSADVLHAHMFLDVFEQLDVRPRPGQLVVRHYHGSIPPYPSPGEPYPVLVENDKDDAIGAVQVGARLYHLRFSPRMQWLPIPVPVADYAALAAAHYVPREDRPGKRLRVCHSPTNRRIKGTTALEHVLMDLVAEGAPIELVMVEGKSHGEALRLKATCDVTFDSFWLGIQGSGLEAAAMGQAVIAGDPEVRDEYGVHVGECPYTYANTFEELKVALRGMIDDDSWRQFEARRVEAYCRTYHDYPVVGARYWAILEAAFKERGYGPSA